MTRILFVCLGNICRSPMAEFIFRDLVEKRGLGAEFFVASAGTSSEELGNPVYPPARKKLLEHGIDPSGKRAVQLKPEDGTQYDWIIGMELRNLNSIHRIIGFHPSCQVKKLMEFTSRPQADIADPWWTEDFDRAYEDILEGCQGLLDFLTK